jgi:hypothetical protein
VFFCIRDDDTSFFTSPDDLEHAYGEMTRWGPVSLAIVPFCRAGLSKGVPEAFRGSWSVHPLDENRPLVAYLRDRIRQGRFEPMLHGYFHDERHGRPEFAGGADLQRRMQDGRRYLETILGTTIRVFVPPHNTIGRDGLRALGAAGLHLCGIAGLRAGWSPWSSRTWAASLWLGRWHRSGGCGIPRVLDLGDHREIAGVPVTPASSLPRAEAAFEAALERGGVFCAATHYWELDAPSLHEDHGTVGSQLHHLVDRARRDPRVRWCSVGDAVAVDGAAAA